jgi:predicted ATP-binding protein involved in virulence
MAKSPKLVEVSVSKLLGQFDHTVAFPPEHEFVILYGPNGIGKTRLLEMISNTFSGRMSRIARVPFRSAIFNFEDGTRLTLDNSFPRQSEGDVSPPYSLRIFLEKSDGETAEWLYSRERHITPGRLQRLIDQFTPAHYVGAGRYLDPEIGETVGREEIIDKYGHMIPSELLPYSPSPEQIKNFLAGSDVHLIETQRLLTRVSQARDRSRTETSNKITVQEFSEDFSRRMREALAQNSRTSQELDRTFPRRVLSAGSPPAAATEQAIRERYDEQSRLRSRLAEISLLQGASDLPLPDQKLDSSQRLVLWTYLDDSERKLATFEDLLRRVQLFRDIVNSRFQFKQLHLNRDGFNFVTDLGQEIPAEALSSGEQHELVLAYDLLFNVAKNGLVLIDEPEISLHVAWQQEFLNDIAKIAQTASLRFMIATHSPQIIHKWRNRAVGLGANI